MALRLRAALRDRLPRVGTGREVHLFGSRPPANDSLWERAQREGFEVRVFDRNAANKEKQVDVSLATTVMEDSYEHMKPARGDRVVLIAGDGDYSPTLESLASRGIPTSVVFWRHATARALINFADQFHALDSHLDFLAGHAGATLPILAAWASLPSCGRKSELPREGSWWLDVVPNVFRKLQCST